MQINSNKWVGLQDFVADALHWVDQGGAAPLVILNDNKPAFYVLQPQEWDWVCQQLSGVQALGAVHSALLAPPTPFADLPHARSPAQGHAQGRLPENAPEHAPAPAGAQAARALHRAAALSDPRSEQRAFEKKNNFTFLGEQLLDLEWERVARKELSASSVGIQKN